MVSDKRDIVNAFVKSCLQRKILLEINTKSDFAQPPHSPTLWNECTHTGLGKARARVRTESETTTPTKFEKLGKCYHSLGNSAPFGTTDEIGLTMSTRSKLTIGGKASTLTILASIKSSPYIWFAQRSKVSNLPFYPPFRAADIPADVFARKMKTVRIHRHRKWSLSR